MKRVETPTFGRKQKTSAITFCIGRKWGESSISEELCHIAFCSYKYLTSIQLIKRENLTEKGTIGKKYTSLHKLSNFRSKHDLEYADHASI